MSKAETKASVGQAPVAYIRWMIRRDMAEVLGIEMDSFEYPWSEDNFVRCLRQRNVMGMVAENDNEDIVGFMIYELHKSRLHIRNFAVGEQWRRYGVGTAMLNRIKKKLHAERRIFISLDLVDEHKDWIGLEGARQFFESVGFTALSEVKRYEARGHWVTLNEPDCLGVVQYWHFVPAYEQVSVILEYKLPEEKSAAIA